MKEWSGTGLGGFFGCGSADFERGRLLEAMADWFCTEVSSGRMPKYAV